MILRPSDFEHSANSYQIRVKNHYQQRYDMLVPNAFWRDIEMDLICFRRSGFCDEFEIKLSRSDFLADFKKTVRASHDDHEKHQPWGMPQQNKHSAMADGMLLPNYFYFVLKDGIADPSEIDHRYGVIFINDRGRLTVSREAKKLHGRKVNDSQKLRFAMKLCYRWWDNAIT